MLYSNLFSFFLIILHAFSLSDLRTRSVLVSFGKIRFKRNIEIARVTIFSGEIGSQRKAMYEPETATSQFIWKYVPIARAIYDHPLVIIQAIAMHSRSRGFVKNCSHFLIFCFVIFFMISPSRCDVLPYYNRPFFTKNSLHSYNNIICLFYNYTNYITVMCTINCYSVFDL